MLLGLAACDAGPTRAQPRFSFGLAAEATAPMPATGGNHVAPFPRASTLDFDVGAPNSPGAAPPVASPRTGAPGGGSGGGSQAGSGFGGRVWGLRAEGEGPVAGAVVRLSDGRNALTDEEGRYRFEGQPPADGAYLVSHVGYLPSSVHGVSGRVVDLHLQGRNAFTGAAPPASTSLVQVSGQVLDPDGLPVADARVVARDGRGGEGGPVSTGDDGRFTMDVQAVDGRFEDASFLALDAAGGNRLGQLTGVTLAGVGAGPVIALRPAAHKLRNLVDATGTAGTVTTTMAIVGPHGESFSLGTEGAELPFTALPACRLSVDVTARDNDQRTLSVLHKQDLVLARGQASTAVVGTLLRPPVVASGAALDRGAAITWAPVTGARGYHLALSGIEGQGATWEAFTTLTETPFNHPGTLGRGQYALSVTAWDYPGLAPRSVASLRALRLLPAGAPTEYRRATRMAFVTRAP